MTEPRQLIGEDHPPYWLAGALDDPAAPVLVSIHGISRNACEHALAFHEPARRQGITVIAPLFAADRFPDYQRLGRRGARADLALLAVLADAEARLGRAIDRVHLFGFSGGAQFAHRFALAWPHLVERLSLAAAGWYTMPIDELRFPYGLAPCRRLPDLRFRLVPLLRRPIRVFVGEHDRIDDPATRHDPRVDAHQGRHRLERARRWCEALLAAGRARGLHPDVRLEILPHAGHDFAECADPARGDLIRRVLEDWDTTREEAVACAA